MNLGMSIALFFGAVGLIRNTYFLNLEEAAQLTDNKMETAQVYLEDMFDHPVKTDVFNEIGRFRYIRQ